MNILVIAYPYISLYKDIQLEIIRQGHNVTFFEDKRLPHDIRCHHSFIRRKLMECIWEASVINYWKKCINEQECLSVKYDLLFVLSGYSIHRSIIEHLRSINPKIRTVFYTWDPCNYYSFDDLLPLFDKAYTFDIEDCRKDSRWNFLPIYHKVFESHADKTSFDYHLSFIGTNHDRRYSIVKSLLPIMKQHKLKYFIRIIDTQKSIAPVQKLLYALRLLPRHKIDEISFRLEKENTDLLCRDFIIDSEYNQITDKSLCVLDTARSSQSGLTARFMWAIAAGKKVITTNRHAYSYDFVNPKQVFILNSESEIPFDFITQDLKTGDRSFVDQYRIDNWVKQLLS